MLRRSLACHVHEHSEFPHCLLYVPWGVQRSLRMFHQGGVQDRHLFHEYVPRQPFVEGPFDGRTSTHDFRLAHFAVDRELGDVALDPSTDAA